MFLHRYSTSNFDWRGPEHSILRRKVASFGFHRGVRNLSQDTARRQTLRRHVHRLIQQLRAMGYDVQPIKPLPETS